MSKNTFKNLRDSLASNFKFVEEDDKTIDYEVFKYYSTSHEYVKAIITLFKSSEDHGNYFISISITPVIGMFGNKISELGFSLSRILTFVDKMNETQALNSVYMTLDALYEGYKSVYKFMYKQDEE